jgi:hypothetical protein
VSPSVDLGDPGNPPQIIVSQDPPVVTIDWDAPSVSFAQDPPQLDLNWPTTVEIPLGVGIQGPAGRDGSFTLTLLSGTTLGSGRVAVSIAGALVYADSADAAQLSLPIYLTLGSSTGPGQEVPVLPLGVYNDGAWSLVPDGVLYVGRNGALTQTVPSAAAGDAYLRAVGQATDTDTIFFEPQPAIRLI